MSKHVLNALGCILMIYLLISLYGEYRNSINTDDTDISKDQRSGLKLHTDYKTGCQYLASVRGGLFPRIEEDGQTHYGCGKHDTEENP